MLRYDFNLECLNENRITITETSFLTGVQTGLFTSSFEYDHQINPFNKIFNDYQLIMSPRSVEYNFRSNVYPMAQSFSKNNVISRSGLLYDFEYIMTYIDGYALTWTTNYSEGADPKVFLYQ